jgi:hypothetical protein
MLNRKTKNNGIKTSDKTKIGVLTESWDLSDRHQEIAATWVRRRKQTGFFLHIPVEKSNELGK